MTPELLQVTRTIGYPTGFFMPLGFLGLVIYALYRLIKKYTK